MASLRYFSLAARSNSLVLFLRAHPFSASLLACTSPHGTSEKARHVSGIRLQLNIPRVRVEPHDPLQDFNLRLTSFASRISPISAPQTLPTLVVQQPARSRRHDTGLAGQAQRTMRTWRCPSGSVSASRGRSTCLSTLLPRLPCHTWYSGATRSILLFDLEVRS